MGWPARVLRLVFGFRLVRLPSSSVPLDRLQGGHEDLEIHRLLEKGIGLDPELNDALLLMRVTREHQHPFQSGRAAFREHAQDVGPIHVGEHEVEEHHVVSSILDPGERGGPVTGLVDPGALMN
jgi:hypothetical protein